LRFATDVILCAATFIGEIIAFVESLLKKERAGPLEFCKITQALLTLNLKP